MASISSAKPDRTGVIATPTAAASHGTGDTFTIKTLKSIIESQARWTEEDLKRLQLVR